MNSQPHIFVGTMFCGEGDFEKSTYIIHKQNNVIVTHHIIAGLDEIDAHNELWSSWRKEKDNHDLFVKIDADTVLRSTETLSNIWDEFQKNSRITGVQAPLHDYMTDTLINGLNCFSTQVEFNDSKDNLYCDRQVDTNHDIVLRHGKLPANLEPAGFHCYYASDVQAFHYGLHRMLKNQLATINDVYAAWVRNKDRTRAFALFGAKFSSRFLENRKFNYCDDEFKSSYKETLHSYDDWVDLLSNDGLSFIK